MHLRFFAAHIPLWYHVAVLEKGKLVARRGRKATGLSEEEAAGLPKGVRYIESVPLRA